VGDRVQRPLRRGVGAVVQRAAGVPPRSGRAAFKGRLSWLAGPAGVEGPREAGSQTQDTMRLWRLHEIPFEPAGHALISGITRVILDA
jgi:hypothetical protein